MNRFITLTICLFALGACAAQQTGQTTATDRVTINTLTTTTTTTKAYGVCADLFVKNAPVVSGKQITPLCEADGDDIVYFASGYSRSDNRSIWSAYMLNKELISAIQENTNDHRSSSFRQNPALRQSGYRQPSHADYTNSGYNRGHYAPSKALAWDAEAQRATFMISNIAPQNGPMNQNLWRCFEVTIRDWAEFNDTVKVVVGSVGNDGTIGQNAPITVPTHYFAMVYREKPRPMALGIFVPNRAGYLDIRQHVRSIAQLRGRNGYPHRCLRRCRHREWSLR